MECGGNNFDLWQAVSYSFKSIFLCYGVFLAFMTRSLPGSFNESAYIGLAVYNMAFCSGVVLLVLYTAKTQETLTGVFYLCA